MHAALLIFKNSAFKESPRQIPFDFAQGRLSPG
jgi:hypothetical protein